MSSIDSFNQRSHPNEMLTGLRYFERANKGDNGNLTKVSVITLSVVIFIYRKRKFNFLKLMILITTTGLNKV